MSLSSRPVIPIVTRSVKGKFRNFKTAVMVIAYMVYFGLPWFPWQRFNGQNQAVMFDFDTHQFFVFNLIIYPQDIFWLALLLFISAVLLFFVTGLVGRAWCGYFCFQTLWTDLFIRIEHLIQGERNARLRLKQQAWNIDKVFRISLSHSLMILISGWTAITFVAYFDYAPQFIQNFWQRGATIGQYTMTVVLTFTTYICAGIFREKICLIACPYARFQNVMYDKTTLTVSYDVQRGEGKKGRLAPQKKIKTQEERIKAGHGDCIDCGFCVDVCPTGIDIRNGASQYECISCGLCVDACNNVMRSINLPQGLIRYDSEANLALPTPSKPKIYWHSWRNRGYAFALLIMSWLLFYNISSQTKMEVDIHKIHQPLYTLLSNGKIRNQYVLHLVNKTQEEQDYDLQILGLPQNVLNFSPHKNINVRAGKKGLFNFRIDLPEDVAKETRELRFRIRPIHPKFESISEETALVTTSFNSPVRE